MMDEWIKRLFVRQRQHIGVARTLHQNPNVLSLDELTNVLNNLTDQACMKTVTNFGHIISIIFTTHRLTTFRECDQIMLFGEGIVKAKGSFKNSLKKRSTQGYGFKSLNIYIYAF